MYFDMKVCTRELCHERFSIFHCSTAQQRHGEQIGFLLYPATMAPFDEALRPKKKLSKIKQSWQAYSLERKYFSIYTFFFILTYLTTLDKVKYKSQVTYSIGCNPNNRNRKEDMQWLRRLEFHFHSTYEATKINMKENMTSADCLECQISCKQTWDNIKSKLLCLLMKA